MKHASLWIALGLIVVVAGTTWIGVPAPEPASTNTASSSLSPMGRVKQALIDKALRGLTIGERVTIDATVERTPTGSADELEAKGDDLLAHNQSIQAMGAYTEAILASQAADATLFDKLGRALQLAGKKEPAEAAFLTALDMEPERVNTIATLGDLYWSASRKDEAIARWNEALGLDANLGEPVVRLAIAAYYDGELAEARELIARAEQLGALVPPQLFGLIDAAEKSQTVPHAPMKPRGGGDVTVGPQIRVDVGGGTFASNETSIAAVAVNDTEIVATWNDWRRSPTIPNELINMGVATSIDGGETWTDKLVRPPPANASDVEGDPMTAYDARTGNLWVGAISFFGIDGGLYVARKEPGAAEPLPSVQVGQISFADKCWMAAGPMVGNPDSTAVYISYNEGTWRSFDMGDTWEINSGPWPGGIAYLPRVGADGTLYVAYFDLNTKMRITRSYDNGVSFTLPVIAAQRMDSWGIDGTRFPGDFRVVSAPAFAIDPATGHLYYAYPDTTNIVDGNSNVDIYLTISTDGGDTWSVPIIINDDPDPPGDQFFPWIEIDNESRIHMVFHDSSNVIQDDFQGSSNGPPAFLDAYYSYSDDGGQTWEEFRLTPETFNTDDDGLDRTTQFIGDYNGLAVADNRVYPLYISTQNGDSDIFTHIIEKTAAICEGDANGDGLVDPLDSGYVQSRLGCLVGSGDPECDAADANVDGIVDPLDVGFVLSRFGACL